MTESPYMAVVRAKLRQAARCYASSYRGMAQKGWAMDAYDAAAGAVFAHIVLPAGASDGDWSDYGIREKRLSRIQEACAARVAELEGRV